MKGGMMKTASSMLILETKEGDSKAFPVQNYRRKSKIILRYHAK